MTFEKLLGMSSKEWQEISDEDLYKVLEPFFIVTRPEKAIGANTNIKTKEQRIGKNMASLQKQLMELATKQGILLPSK